MTTRIRPVFCFFLTGMILILPGSGFTVEETVNSALRHNSDLRQQALLLENARREKANRWNTFLPSISLNGGFSNTHIFTPDTAATWSWNASAGLSLSFSAGIPVKLKQKALAFEIAQTAYAQKERSIIKEVVLSYYALIALRTNISILENNLRLSEELYRQNKINYDNGLTSELDMLRSQYAYLKAGPELQLAESAYRSSLEAFLILIGQDTGEPESNDIPPLYELSLPEADVLIQAYRGNRLDIVSLQLAAEQAELDRLSSVLERQTPSLNLQESLRLSPDGKNAFSSAPGAGGTFSVSLSIPIDSLIPGSGDSLAVSAAANAAAAAKIALEAGEKKAAHDIYDCVAETQRLYRMLSVSNLNHQITERAYNLAMDGYNNGLVSQTDMETARQDMTAAWQSVVQAEIDYLSAVYNLADALQLGMDDVYSLWGIK